MSTRTQFEIALKGQDWSGSKQFVFGQKADYFLDWGPLQKRFDGNLPARWLDLLRLGSTIYFADLAIQRRNRKHPGRWNRSIHLSAPVLDTVFWRDETIQSLLNELVGFLTGDDWSIVLTASAKADSAPCERQRQLAFEFGEATTCLYSGGLDSAAGLAKRLQSDPNDDFSPMTVGHRSDICSQVADQLLHFRELYGSRLHPISIAFENRLRGRGLNTEPSQRSRSLLFLSVGAVVAAIDGADRLEVYESGIGSINAPLLAGMRNSQATRGLHPRTIRLMQALLSAAFEQPFTIEAPFANSTKAEVVRALSDGGSAIAMRTISCVHYPIRHIAGAGHRQCGICPACLFRRVALTSAGIEEPGKNYQYDLLDPNCAIPLKKRWALIAFLNQVDAIAASGDNELPTPIAAHLKASGMLTTADQLSQFAKLYRRYADDWGAFIRQGRRNGCDWTKLIDARSAAA